jgi:hypothetical protein
VGFGCPTRFLKKLIMKSYVSQAMVEALTLASEKVNMIIVNPFTCM